MRAVHSLGGTTCLGIHQRGVQSEGGAMDGGISYSKTAYHMM